MLRLLLGRAMPIHRGPGKGEGALMLLLCTRVPLPCRSSVPSCIAGASERECSGSAAVALPDCPSCPAGPSGAAATAAIMIGGCALLPAVAAGLPILSMGLGAVNGTDARGSTVLGNKPMRGCAGTTACAGM